MTATSNIYSNSTAWVTLTTYSVGDVRANVGNGYRCTTGGLSGVTGPTGTGGSISDGTVVWKYLSSVDYTSIAAFEAGIPGTLTQPVVGQIWNDGETQLGSTVVFNGHTTTITNFITLTAAPGEGFADNPNAQTNALFYNAANGVGLVNTTGYVNMVELDDQYSVMSRLQIKQTLNGRPLQGGGQNVVYNGLIVATHSSGNSSTTGDNTQFINTVFYGNGGCGFGSKFQWINSTFYNCSLSGSYAGSNVANNVIENCLFIDCTFGTGSGGPNGTVSNCVFTDASLPSAFTSGGSNVFGQTDTTLVVNIASDYKLKTGSAAVNAGATATTYIPTSVDIVGTTRPQGSAWDVGAWELVVAATVTLSWFPALNLFAPLLAPQNQSRVFAPTNIVPNVGWLGSRTSVPQTIRAIQSNTFGPIRTVITATTSIPWLPTAQLFTAFNRSATPSNVTAPVPFIPQQWLGAVAATTPTRLPAQTPSAIAAPSLYFNPFAGLGWLLASPQTPTILAPDINPASVAGPWYILGVNPTVGIGWLPQISFLPTRFPTIPSSVAQPAPGPNGTRWLPIINAQPSAFRTPTPSAIFQPVPFIAAYGGIPWFPSINNPTITIKTVPSLVTNFQFFIPTVVQWLPKQIGNPPISLPPRTPSSIAAPGQYFNKFAGLGWVSVPANNPITLPEFFNPGSVFYPNSFSGIIVPTIGYALANDYSLYAATATDTSLYTAVATIIPYGGIADMNIYAIGDLLALTVQFSDAITGNPIDPTAVTLRVLDPLDNETDYTTTAAQITKIGVGNYSFDLYIGVAGFWAYRWEGTGAVVTAVEQRFQVQLSSFAAPA